MTQMSTVDNMENQLRSLYQEREQLAERFGVSTPDEIIRMVENLEGQLRDFYNRFEGYAGFDDPESMMVLSKIKELSQALDPLYSRKSVHFSIENNKPVLRAEWTEALNQGDDE
jgi:hypothetical protein